MVGSSNSISTEITKGQQKRKKEIVAEVNVAAQAHNETNMCFYSSVVGHHPSVSFQAHGIQRAMIVDGDDKGQVVTGRWTGKMARPGFII